MTLSRVFRLLICVFLVNFINMPAYSQALTYPNKLVRIIVPYPAGGSGDGLARSIAAKLSEIWGQPVIVENKPGASGMIGTEAVAKSPPDGYTLLLGTEIQFSINPSYYPKISYDPEKDFEPITLAAYIQMLLTVPTSSGIKSLPELIARIKANPEKFNYASAGNGSTHHLIMELFKSYAGLEITHVPYKGSGQVFADLITNQVQMMFAGVSQAQPYIAAGKLTPLAVGSDKRLKILPEVPTFAETYPGFEGKSSWSLFAPAGTPKPIITKINSDVIKVLKMPEIEDRLTKAGFELIGSTPEELTAAYRAEREKWTKVIKQNDLRAD